MEERVPTIGQRDFATNPNNNDDGSGGTQKRYAIMGIHLAPIKLEPLKKEKIAKAERKLVATEIGYVKGGLEAVKKRKASLQTGMPCKFVLSAFPCERASLFGKFWRNHFTDKREQGKWYDLSD